jgi:MoxR-like ATPase
VQGAGFATIKQVVSVQELSNAKDLVKQIYMDEKIEQYILDIVFATRNPEKYKMEKLKPLISYGASPRGSINLALAAKSQAFLNKRGFVIPEDVRSICNDVLRHRIGLTYEAEAESINVEGVIEEVLKQINVP